MWFFVRPFLCHGFFAVSHGLATFSFSAFPFNGTKCRFFILKRHFEQTDGTNGKDLTDRGETRRQSLSVSILLLVSFGFLKYERCVDLLGTSER